MAPSSPPSTTSAVPATPAVVAEASPGGSLFEGMVLLSPSTPAPPPVSTPALPAEQPSAGGQLFEGLQLFSPPTPSLPSLDAVSCTPLPDSTPAAHSSAPLPALAHESPSAFGVASLRIDELPQPPSADGDLLAGMVVLQPPLSPPYVTELHSAVAIYSAPPDSGEEIAEAQARSVQNNGTAEQCNREVQASTSFTEAPAGALLDATELDADAKELDTFPHSPVIASAAPGAFSHAAVNVPEVTPAAETTPVALDLVGAAVTLVTAPFEVLEADSPLASANAHTHGQTATLANGSANAYAEALAAAQSAGADKLLATANALLAAEAKELQALAVRRAAIDALASAEQHLGELQQRQAQLCEQEEFAAADELNGRIASAEAAVQDAEAARSTAEASVRASSAATLYAAAQEASAWDELVMQVENQPSARAQMLQDARERCSGLRSGAAQLTAERDALAAALSAKEAQLSAALAELRAAEGRVRALEHAHALTAERALPDSMDASQAAALSAQLRAVASVRRERVAASQRAAASVSAMASAEAAAEAALRTATQRELEAAREVALLVGSQAGLQQAATAARDAVAVAARQLAVVEEQKATAVATKAFKDAAKFAAIAKTLAAERDSAEGELAAHAARLEAAVTEAKRKAQEVAFLRESVSSCRRAAALARWRRLRVEASVRSRTRVQGTCKLRTYFCRGRRRLVTR